MSRTEGFDVMDVSTSICHDPKFRRLQREEPQHVAVAFTAYVSVMAESWRAGKRVSVAHAWPAFLPFDQLAVDALVRVGLLDRGGSIPPRPWRGWFTPANDRRCKTRTRWARYNAKRDAETALAPRGNDAATATSVRPSVRQSEGFPTASGDTTGRARLRAVGDPEGRTT